MTTNKLFLQNDVDTWDPASEGGDETEIAQLSAFLERQATRTRRGTESHIFIAHNHKQISTSAAEFLLLVNSGFESIIAHLSLIEWQQKFGNMTQASSQVQRERVSGAPGGDRHLIFNRRSEQTPWSRYDKLSVWLMNNKVGGRLLCFLSWIKLLCLDLQWTLRQPRAHTCHRSLS